MVMKYIRNNSLRIQICIFYNLFMHEEVPTWLEVGRLIDAQDKHGDWQVALVQRVFKNQVRVRFDGWQAKHDENFSFNSSSIAPFRSVVRGYTGQTKHPGIRDHMLFNLEELKQIHSPHLDTFISEVHSKSADEIVQFIRGHHYILIDFFLTKTFEDAEQVQEVYAYFQKHVRLTLLYLKKMIEAGVDEWFNGKDKNLLAFADAHYQIFDSVQSIMEGYLRHKDFFVSNLNFIQTTIAPSESNLKYWHTFLTKIDFYSHLTKIISLLEENKTVKVPLTFMRSLTMLYFTLEKTLSEKELKIKLSKSLLKSGLKESLKITEVSAKNEEKDLQEIYKKAKMILMKYTWKDKYLHQFELASLHCWEKLIRSDSLEKKIHGISMMKRYFENLLNDNKLMMMVYGQLDEMKLWLKTNKVIELIFCLNEHHEIMKKGCQFATFLYQAKCLDTEDLVLIWNSCRERLQAVRKIMYLFFEKLVRVASDPDIKVMTKLIIKNQLIEQYDAEFFYTFAEEVVELRNNDIEELVHEILCFALARTYSFASEINKFATILVLNPKHIISSYILKLIHRISENSNILHNLKILFETYRLSDLKDFDLAEDSLYLLLTTLYSILKSQQANNHETMETVSLLLKMVESLDEEEFDFEPEEFINLWTLFSRENNLELKQKVFYDWILSHSTLGIFKVEHYSLNKCLKKMQMAEKIFKEIMKNSNIMDYINMNGKEFLIFQLLLLEVNTQSDRIFVVENHLSGIKFMRVKEFDIDGLNELWAIFLNCRDQNVVLMVVQLLEKLYLNVPENYGRKERENRLKGLLSKLQRNIKSGLQKRNMKLINRSLLLLREVISFIKQSKSASDFMLSSNSGQSKKMVTIIFKNVGKEEEFSVSESLKNLKKAVENEEGIKPYNLKMSRPIMSPTQDEFVFEEVPREFMVLPLFIMSSGQEKLVLKVEEIPNTCYQYLEEFINTKMEENLVKILSDTDSLSHETSEYAHSIMLAIPSRRSPVQVVHNLLSKQSDLAAQSLHYRLYLTKNINSMPETDLQELIEKHWVFKNLIEQFSCPFTEPMYLEFIHQILVTISKSLRITKSSLLNPEDVILCLRNFVKFVTLKSEHKTSKDENSIKNKFRLMVSLFELLENLSQKDDQKALHYLIRSPAFPEIMHELYTNKSTRKEYKCVFDSKFINLIKESKKRNPNFALERETEDILFSLLLNDIYPSLAHHSHNQENHNSFYRVFKETISILGAERLKRLYEKTDNNVSFWESCLSIVLGEEDFSEGVEKENSLFSGHLEVMRVLVLRNPSIISEQIVNFVFFTCLFYDPQFTKSEQVKCKSQKSIHVALNFLETVCRSNQQYLNYIIENLRRFQATNYWRTAEKWNICLENQFKSETGFVGLDNPGCICYLNSFMQTLFLNSEFRKKIINYEEPISEVKCENEENSKERKYPSILQSMKELFLNLKFSNKKYLSPLNFTKSIRTVDNKDMIRIFEQMDIEQFCSILFDKLENLLPKEHNFVKQLYQGVYSNEIISQECKHCSEREENFISIQIDVKSSIQESLKTLVKGEILEKENAYYCERCDKKVKALKRVSLKKLPDHLLVCLKRFEFNFEYDQKIKLNSYCEFSQDFSLKEYSRQYLNQDSALEKNEEHYPDSYFEYKLKGVIIHTGYVDNGHYYTLAEVSAGKWLEFNDNFVTEFRKESLAYEAFGCKDINDTKVKNAYILVYERKQKFNQLEESETMESEGKLGEIENEKSLEIVREIERNNKQIQVFELLFSQDYYAFVRETLKILHDSSIDPQTSENLIKFFVEYSLMVRIRDANALVVIECLDFLEKILQNPLSDNIFLMLLDEICEKHLAYEFFIESASKEKAMIFSRFVVSVLVKKMNQNSDKFMPMILKMLSALIEVLIEVEVNVNTICYIFRKMMNHSERLYEYLEDLDLSSVLIDNFAAVRFTPEDKDDKIEKLEASLKDIHKGMSEEWIVKGRGLYLGDNIHTHTQAYQLKGECSEEGWYILFKMFQKQDQIIELGSNAENGQSESEVDAAFQFFKAVEMHHGYLLNEFETFSINKITYFFDNATSYRAIIALSHFLCEMSKNSELRTEKILSVIKKALKNLEGVKFRPFLLALYYLCEISDLITNQRFEEIKKIIDMAIEQNGKYFSECDILLQWIQKICSVNPTFTKAIQGDYSAQFLKITQTHKGPTSELLKKQKNPHFERLLYRYHGLLVSTIMDDYVVLAHEKSQFYNRLFLQEYQSTHEKKYLEPGLSYFEGGYKIGQKVECFLEKEKMWAKSTIVESKYGILKLKRKKGEEIEELTLWENEDRLREIVGVSHQE